LLLLQQFLHAGHVGQRRKCKPDLFLEMPHRPAQLLVHRLYRLKVDSASSHEAANESIGRRLVEARIIGAPHHQLEQPLPICTFRVERW
jgi:hypothetical protein